MSNIQEQIKIFEDAIFKNRAKRLSRGSIRLQRGLFCTPNEWQQQQQQHSEKLKRVSHKLCPELY